MSEAPREIVCFLLSGFGAAFLLHKLSQLIFVFLRLMKYSPFCGGKFPIRNYGAWAVVTGATDGIGREYAMQLASKGMNIVLVSRSPSKLADVATAISDLYKVETKVIAADFTRGSDLYAEVGRQLEKLDIGVLVNNVGMVSTPGNFLDVPNREKVHPAMLNCNALSAVGMSCIVLPGMIAKNRGVLINISAIAGDVPIVLPEGVYSATKSFLSSLSRSLHEEYASQGIIIQNLKPGGVATNILENTAMKSGAPSARSYVRAALDTLGTTIDTCGYLSHQVLLEIWSVLPRPVLLLVRARISSSLKAGK